MISKENNEVSPLYLGVARRWGREMLLNAKLYWPAVSNTVFTEQDILTHHRAIGHPIRIINNSSGTNINPGTAELILAGDEDSCNGILDESTEKIIANPPTSGPLSSVVQNSYARPSQWPLACICEGVHVILNPVHYTHDLLGNAFDVGKLSTALMACNGPVLPVPGTPIVQVAEHWVWMDDNLHVWDGILDGHAQWIGQVATPIPH